MNIIYAQAALYMYPHILEHIEAVENRIMKFAINSYKDPSSPIPQFEHVISLQFKKAMLIELKENMDFILSKFNQEQLDTLDYRYFRTKPIEFYMQITSPPTRFRDYYRQVNKLTKKVCERLMLLGFSDEWFETSCIEYTKAYIRTAIEHNENIKNKINARMAKKKEKQG